MVGRTGEECILSSLTDFACLNLRFPALKPWTIFREVANGMVFTSATSSDFSNLRRPTSERGRRSQSVNLVIAAFSQCDPTGFVFQ